MKPTNASKPASKPLAVVTGAKRGIGFGLVERLLARGERVLVFARDAETSRELVALQQKHPSLELLSGDVTQDADVARLVEHVGARGVSLLINNAGILIPEDELLPTTVQSIRKSFEVNTLGPVRVTHALLPALKPASAKVIHITSLMGSIGDNESGGYYAYRMSKAALNMFAKSFSKDYPTLTTAVLHPGWVKTEMGGPEAPTSISESTQGLLNVIDGLGPKDSGCFKDFEGDTLPW